MKLLVFAIVFSIYVIGYTCGYGGKNYANLISEREIKKLENKLSRAALVYEDPSEVSIYYSVIDNHTITDMLPRPWIRPGQSLRLPFIGEPCNCLDLQCGCCAGINITQFNFDHKACANVTYDPFLFGLVLDISVDNSVLLHNVYSAKNPPPFCIPVVISGVPTGIDVCVKLYDIYTPGNKIHVCIDFETRIFSAPVLVLHFDCVTLGLDGVAFVKPDNATGLPAIASPEVSEETAQVPVAEKIDEVIYDEVTEIVNVKVDMTTKTATPDENTIAYKIPNAEEDVDEIIQIMKKASFESQRINNRTRN